MTGLGLGRWLAGALVFAVAGPSTAAQPAVPRQLTFAVREYAAPGGDLARDPSRARELDARMPPSLFSGDVLHAGVSGLLTLSGHYLLVDKAAVRERHALPLAAGAALALGVAKEVADSRRTVQPLFSWRDLAADAVGVALGTLVASL